MGTKAGDGEWNLLIKFTVQAELLILLILKTLNTDQAELLIIKMVNSEYSTLYKICTENELKCVLFLSEAFNL